MKTRSKNEKEGKKTKGKDRGGKKVCGQPYTMNSSYYHRRKQNSLCLEHRFLAFV